MGDGANGKRRIIWVIVEEFGEMARETWRERNDRVGGIVVKLGVEECEEKGEAPRKERDDWKVAEMGGESWRLGLRKLGIGGRWGETDGFQGEGRGGVRSG